MNQIPGIIFHKACVDIINDISKPRMGKFGLKNSFKSQSGTLSYNGKFRLKFPSNNDYRNLMLGREFKNVQIKLKQYDLILEDLFLENFGFNNITASITKFHTKGFNRSRKYFYRLIVPLRKELSFFYQMDCLGFTSDLGYKSSLGFQANLDNDVIYGCIFTKDKRQYYLSLESKIYQNWTLFSGKAYAVINSLGFVTGHLPGDRVYYFAYTNSEMKLPEYFSTSGSRPSIVNGFTSINVNPNAYINNRRIAEKYRNEQILRKLTISEFSLLCQKVYSNSDFDTCIILILESCSSSLAIMPGGLAICLESISDIIIGDASHNIKPISDKKIAKALIDECTEVIKKYKNAIAPEGIETLIKKLQHLNQPTNKDRLRLPFLLLGINVTTEDIKVLQARNDLLHGRFPVISKNENMSSIDRINRDLYYTALQLFTLLSMLILKWVGFDNYVLNHPVIQKRAVKYRLKELPYRQIV